MLPCAFWLRYKVGVQKPSTIGFWLKILILNEIQIQFTNLEVTYILVDYILFLLIIFNIK